MPYEHENDASLEEETNRVMLLGVGLLAALVLALAGAATALLAAARGLAVAINFLRDESAARALAPGPTAGGRGCPARPRRADEARRGHALRRRRLHR